MVVFGCLVWLVRDVHRKSLLLAVKSLLRYASVLDFVNMWSKMVSPVGKQKNLPMRLPGYYNATFVLTDARQYNSTDFRYKRVSYRIEKTVCLKWAKVD